jgi:hypothetical protein
MGAAPVEGVVELGRWGPGGLRGRLLRFVVEAIAMGSLLDELARREAAARQRIEEIREEMAGLEAGLEAEEDRLSRLVIARETVEEILGEGSAVVERAEVASGRGVDEGTAAESLGCLAFSGHLNWCSFMPRAAGSGTR